jgi:hypothetical protein
MGQSNSYYPDQMRKWWMCSKVKLYEKCVAQEGQVSVEVEVQQRTTSLKKMNVD